MNGERVRAAERVGPEPADDRVAAETARVRRLCEHAIAYSFGAAVIAVRPVSDDGRIGVWLSSWPRADEARRALEPAGYLVSEMDPAPVHGVGLVVVDGLQVRLSDEQLVEVEIAASSLLVERVLRELVPRLVAEARASRVSLARGVAAAVSARRLGVEWDRLPAGRRRELQADPAVRVIVGLLDELCAAVPG